MKKKPLIKTAAALLTSALLAGSCTAVFAAEETDTLVEYTETTNTVVSEYIDVNPFARYGSDSIIVAPRKRSAFTPTLQATAGQKIKVSVMPTDLTIPYEFGYMHDNVDTYCIVSSGGIAGHSFTVPEDGEYIVFVDNTSYTQFLTFGVVFNVYDN
ncbi:MAG: hypothetical protein IJ468_05375 [Lachnospiraceae bacterium]|nr:hypothetical protein [Lachnospiraceae bacterium]